MRLALLALMLTACTPSFDLDALNFGGGDAAVVQPSDAEEASDAIESDLGGYDDAFTPPDAGIIEDATNAAPDALPPDAEITPENLNCHDGLDNDGDNMYDCADPDCGVASCDDHDD